MLKKNLNSRLNLDNISKEKLQKERIKVFSHNDLDGVGAVVIADLIWKDVDVSILRTNHINEAIDEFISMNQPYWFDRVFILDFALSEYNMKKLSRFDNVLVIDHHQQSKKYRDLDYTLIDTKNTSATEIFYKYLSKPIINKKLLSQKQIKCLQEYVEIVTIQDTGAWKNNGKKSLDYNHLLHSSCHFDFADSIREKILKGKLNFCPKEKETIKKYRERIIKLLEKQVSSCKYIKGKKYNYVWIEGGRYGSYMSYKLIKELKQDIDFVLITNREKGYMSFHTERENIDLSSLASNYGGGGHKKASGAPYDKRVFEFI